MPSSDAGVTPTSSDAGVTPTKSPGAGAGGKGK